MDEFVERNKTLIDWSSNFFGIFWGIWWGIFIEKLIGFEKPVLSFKECNSTTINIFIITIGVFFFTRMYVDWLWKIKSLSKTKSSYTTRKYLNFPISCLSIIYFLLFRLSKLYKIDLNLLLYGLLLTGLWMLLNWNVVKSY